MAEGTLAAVQRRLTDDLGGTYQIVRLLGQGAFGAVYLARDRVLHRLVAIKVLRLERAASETERARFRLEARTAALLDHPSIAPILGFVETPTTLYMVMPYIGGESLAQRLQKSGRLAPVLVRHVLREVAAALAHAHRIGVVHRDLKPENVLLTAGDEVSARGAGALPRVRLVDFGIAAFPNRDLGAGTVREHGGTPNFMSPEQALGESDFGPKTDVYALGVLGYLMLAGKLPFTGSSLTARLSEQRKGPTVPLARAAPRAPSDLVVAIDKCLEFEALNRWRNVRELYAGLSTDLVWQRSGPRALFARVIAKLRGRQALAAGLPETHYSADGTDPGARANASQVGHPDLNISQISAVGGISQIGGIDPNISQIGIGNISQVGLDPNASAAGGGEPDVSGGAPTDPNASQTSSNLLHAPGPRPLWRKDE